MKLYILFYWIILIIFLFYYVQYYISSKEKFSNITGAVPNNNWTSWQNENIILNNISNDHKCNISGLCNTENGWGLYNKNCDCIINKEKNIQEEEEKIIEEEHTNNIYQTKTVLLDNDCIHNKNDFNKYCKEKNSNYGIKKIIKCDDNYSKVICDKNYINEIYYGNNISITPCLNKTDDFDTWCKFYNNNKIPYGFNINSIGTKHLLIGKKGDCYLNNGNPDNSKARAVCDYNHVDSVSKLEPIYNNDYNVFTTCMPYKNNFNDTCKKIFNKDAKAIEIMGYDCNPGFLRAKCIKRGDIQFSVNNNVDDNITCNDYCNSL